MSTEAHSEHDVAKADTSRNEPEVIEVDEDELAMQIAAAQLRLVTDSRLNKVTPEWVKELARQQPRHAS